MPGLVHHHQGLLGYLMVTSVFAAIAMAAWMVLNFSARILTNWQAGRW